MQFENFYWPIKTKRLITVDLGFSHNEWWLLNIMNIIKFID